MWKFKGFEYDHIYPPKDKEDMYLGVVITNDNDSANILDIGDQSLIRYCGGRYLFNNYFHLNQDDELNGFIQFMMSYVNEETQNLLINVFGENVNQFNAGYLCFVDLLNDFQVSYDRNGNFPVNVLPADIEFLQLYGNRKISQVFEFFKFGSHDFTGEINGTYGLRTSSSGELVRIIQERFSTKWRDLANTLVGYDYLKPFNITLDESSTDVLSTTVDRTTYTDNDKTYAFNSLSSVDTDKADGESNREYERENPKTRNYTRVGNIGNQSFSELTIKEREKANFELKRVIFEDIASVLCLEVYND